MTTEEIKELEWVESELRQLSTERQASGSSSARLLPRTIDDVCNQPPGSFAKFVREQQEAQLREENDRRERIRKARNRAG